MFSRKFSSSFLKLPAFLKAYAYFLNVNAAWSVINAQTLFQHDYQRKYGDSYKPAELG